MGDDRGATRRAPRESFEEGARTRLCGDDGRTMTLDARSTRLRPHAYALLLAVPPGHRELLVAPAVAAVARLAWRRAPVRGGGRCLRGITKRLVQALVDLGRVLADLLVDGLLDIARGLLEVGAHLTQ